MSVQKKLDKIWTRFILALKTNHPFFASIALYATCKLNEKINISQINNKEIHLEPAFLEPLDDARRFSYLLHQVLHLALQHPYRGRNRNQQLWNIAADIVVNNIISDTTQWPVAPKTAWDFRYKDDSVERVYAKLQRQQQQSSSKENSKNHQNKGSQQNQQRKSSSSTKMHESDSGKEPNKDQQSGKPQQLQQQKNTSSTKTGENDLSQKQNKDQQACSLQENQQQDQGSSLNGFGEKEFNKSSGMSSQSLANVYDCHSDFQTKINKDSKKMQEYWRSAMVKAQQLPLTRQHGNKSAGLLREMELAIEGQLDWRQLLWKYATPESNDYEEFDQRFIHRGLYLEVLRSEKLTVDVIIDTSGSISRSLLLKFLQELLSIHACHPVVQMSLYYADVELHGPYDIPSHLDDLPIPIGGGGTSFKPYFSYLDKQASLLKYPKVIVYFTDGYGDFPVTAPNAPILWVVTEDGEFDENFPFGIIARIKE